ncbi:tyrosine-protein phosphatase [Novosphingobium cyanobacteriorum]|uniref:Tyrosine-protein phosphatase n=1 Tax=Novosphingobium cyanobacteriorum TaxID=3024215 RepID=A0ABT6CE49_9SPHN|nr:tyrosine-protein phosphatase [Novosphingobium cyanobacteriorum]MDF8332203.1 tyrosine-protein phosphatase [Novosphingobium cyanobacteriorum]
MVKNEGGGTQRNRYLGSNSRIMLAGGQNFREIGGFRTTDGRRLKRGRLWRSAKLDELTNQDVDAIFTLGIRTIADLRRASERSSSPTHEALLARTRVMTWDVQVPDQEVLMAELCRHDCSIEDHFATMINLYRRIPEQHSTQLTDIYAAIADGETPILIHCSAGKDRTGIAVALLLDALGIDQSDIMADYEETERLLDWARLAKTAVAGAGVSGGWIERLTPAALEVLKRSDQRYLEAALREVEEKYGSTAAFMRERLGLSQTSLEQIRAHLLESDAADG